jgi:hypothetical protein
MWQQANCDTHRPALVDSQPCLPPPLLLLLCSVNFHVAKTKQGELRTIKAVHGRCYVFYLAAAAAQGDQQQLVITELDTTQAGQPELQLELLDVGSDGRCGQWGQQLPVRLRELYSHWFCR